MRELVLLCAEDDAEQLSDLLLEEGVLSVSVEDADRDTEIEQPLFGEPGTEPEIQAWKRNQLVALLPDELDPADLLALLQEQTGRDYSESYQVRDVANEDWVRLTQSQFDPIQIAGRIWIVPSWHKENPLVPAANEGAEKNILIELDPGLAFGTGSHPTTRLCTEWLEANLSAGSNVLDYGCGSGILAIVAKKLGAARVLGVDIDEQAVQAAHYNAQVNQAELEVFLPDGLAEGTFDVVVANILSNPLKILAPMLAGRVAENGHLVLSGVLERQAEEVAAAYEPWIKMSVWRSHEGWVCLHGQRA